MVDNFLFCFPLEEKEGKGVIQEEKWINSNLIKKITPYYSEKGSLIEKTILNKRCGLYKLELENETFEAFMNYNLSNLLLADGNMNYYSNLPLEKPVNLSTEKPPTEESK